MEWRGRRQSQNIEDRRSASTGGTGMGRDPFGRSGLRIPVGRRGGGLSFSTIIILIVLYFVLKMMGIDMLQMLDDGSTSGPGYEQTTQRELSPQEKEVGNFVGVVLAETEDTWNTIFSASGERYEEPRLVLFSGATRSACGTASSATGPFYCPGDRKVYLDTDFFQQLAQQFGAAGDFAQAYVVAHEVGHHVQNLLGIAQQVEQQRSRAGQATRNALSVRQELQADRKSVV